MSDSLSSSAPVLQTLLGETFDPYRANPKSFLAGFLAQTLGIVLLVLLINFFPHKGFVPEMDKLIRPLAAISFAPTSDDPSGGGSGGSRSKTADSRGALPPMIMRDQLTPPEAVLNNREPNLPEPPSIMAITNAKLPELGQLGDPLANVQAPSSNGPGERGGIGNNCCGGVGPGHGPGFGMDNGAIYRPGIAGVTLPHAIYDPDPEYSEEARHNKYQGSVILALVVDAQGQPRNLRPQRSLGMGLHEKAMAAVSTW